MKNPQTPWAVIGGGFLGMTLALRLAQRGNRVTLFEAEPALGGVAGAWQLGDIVWDRHYHVTLGSDTELRSLLKDLDLEHALEWSTTRTGFYASGQLHSLSNLVEYLTFPPLGLLGKVRLAATILRASRIRNWQSLESIPVSDWLQRWSGKRVYEKIWLPLLRAKLGENYQQTSAAFIWATIARMYAARRTGLKRELFGYVPGGYARIIERFAAALMEAGVTLRLGRPVRRVVSQTAGMKVELADGTSEVFSRGTATLAAPVIARICPELTGEEKQRLLSIKYQGIICASVLLKKPLSAFYITNIIDPGLPYTAVIEMSALVARSSFRGNSLVYLPKYVSSDSPEFQWTDEQIKDRFLAGLSRMYSHFKREDVLAFRVSRVKYLVPIPTVGYSALVPPTFTSVPGLHVVNSAQIVNGTLNVNETVQLARIAAEQLSRSQEGADRRGDPAHHELTEANCEFVARSR